MYPYSSLCGQAAMQSIISPGSCIPEGNSEQEHPLENFPGTTEVEGMNFFTFKMAFPLLPV